MGVRVRRVAMQKEITMAPTSTPFRSLTPVLACLLLVGGCAAPAATPAAPTTEVAAQSLDSNVSLGLGERDFTMAFTRACADPKGDCPDTSTEKFRCQNFTYEVKAPRDAASGQASGKRQHAPIRIVKEWDAATPLLMRALVANETFKTVTLEFSRNVRGSGKLSVATTITLTDVTVVGLTHVVGSLDPRCPSGDCDDGSTPKELEEVSLMCASMAVSDGKTTAVDDWLVRD
jgi:type VI secretion system secreted protein Hcp